MRIQGVKKEKETKTKTEWWATPPITTTRSLQRRPRSGKPVDHRAVRLLPTMRFMKRVEALAARKRWPWRPSACVPSASICSSNPFATPRVATASVSGATTSPWTASESRSVLIAGSLFTDVRRRSPFFFVMITRSTTEFFSFSLFNLLRSSYTFFILLIFIFSFFCAERSIRRFHACVSSSIRSFQNCIRLKWK